MTRKRAIEILEAYLHQAMCAEEFIYSLPDDQYDPKKLREAEQEIEAFSMAIRELQKHITKKRGAKTV